MFSFELILLHYMLTNRIDHKEMKRKCCVQQVNEKQKAKETKCGNKLQYYCDPIESGAKKVIVVVLS